MPNNTIVVHPIILAGGMGTRLWPLSRGQMPKHLLPLYSKYSLFQETVLRLKGGAYSPPMVICNEEHRFMIAEHLRDLEVVSQGIVLEPVGKNTAPAAIIASLLLNDPNKLMLLMPADHVIQNTEAFHRFIQEGVEAALLGKLVTFGIEPEFPETGFGYIESGKIIDGFEFVREIKSFTEKPDISTAQKYLEQGGYYWNSGIFLFKVKTFLEEATRLSPSMVSMCRDAVEKQKKDSDFIRLDRDIFMNLPSISIDHAIMEHTNMGAVVPTSMGWNDLGSWSALWDIGEKNQDGNVMVGDVLTFDMKDSYVYSPEKLTAIVGLSDVVVVTTDDAVLVAHKDSVQNVKQVVDQLKILERTEHILHQRVHRPWGYYHGIQKGERFQVKTILVKPGASLSLQKHYHRAEHWVVVEGTALVTRGEEKFIVTENQSTYISVGVIHRLENPGKTNLRIVEVQSGSYLEEDDIVRIEDHYNRD